MDLRPLYALLEKGPSVQKHGVAPTLRKKRAKVIYRAAMKVKDKVQQTILNAIAAAIEDGEAREACSLFGQLSPEGRKALPRNLALACGENRIYRDMYPLLWEG
jgi:hypothetical protein